MSPCWRLGLVWSPRWHFGLAPAVQWGREPRAGNRTQRAGVQGQIGRAASLDARQKARATTQMEDIVERGYVIIGSPDEVAEQLTTVATDLNVGHLMMLLQFGSMGKELAKYNTKLFAEKVLPKMRGLFSEWEDKWWPAPMAQTERAAPTPFQATMAAD